MVRLLQYMLSGFLDAAAHDANQKQACISITNLVFVFNFALPLVMSASVCFSDTYIVFVFNFVLPLMMSASVCTACKDAQTMSSSRPHRLLYDQGMLKAGLPACTYAAGSGAASHLNQPALPLPRRYSTD